MKMREYAFNVNDEGKVDFEESTPSRVRMVVGDYLGKLIKADCFNFLRLTFENSAIWIYNQPLRGRNRHLKFIEYGK